MNNNTSLLSEYISATKVKNYVLDDPLLDWLNLYGENIGLIKKKNENKFTDFLKNKGVEFEEKIFNHIRNKYYSKTLDINLSENQGDILTYYLNKYRETISLMNNGIPIIFHGVLFDLESKLFGIPDIIIRSDYINKILNYPCIDKIEDMNQGCNFSNRWHYLIIDIKYSNLVFKKGNNTLNNVGMFSYYKSQVMIYNKCLSYTQSYKPKNAYILGRKWLKEGKKGNNSFDYLGQVDILGKDRELYIKTEMAIGWLRNLHFFGAEWDIFNPTIKELYPNMNNSNYDSEWRHVKEEISLINYDITNLWNCGIKERNNCFKRKIYDWYNPDCNSLSLNIKGKRGKIIDSILDINRNEDDIIISPRRIKNKDNLEKIKKNNLEFIVDFETVNDLNDNFKKLPYSNFNTCIFMIGVIVNYRENEEFKSEFKCFIVEDFSKKEEKRIINEWLDFMDMMTEKYNIPEPKIYHWSNAEPNFYKNAVLRNKKIFDWRKLNFVDLLDIFKEEPISIKGVLGFGLKEISKALFNYGIIKTTWDMDMDGRIAMLEAENAMTESKRDNKLFSKMDIVDVIRKYNFIDCQVLNEILDFLR